MLFIFLQSRYRHTTPLAKTLQEDPSCQLCKILQKYLLQSDVAIDTNLKDPFLPNLSTLRQVSEQFYTQYLKFLTSSKK